MGESARDHLYDPPSYSDMLRALEAIGASEGGDGVISNMEYHMVNFCLSMLGDARWHEPLRESAEGFLQEYLDVLARNRHGSSGLICMARCGTP